MVRGTWLIVFLLSSEPAALAADPGWKKSNFGELEKYILENLDGGQRAKLKMTNPLGVADHVVTQYVANIDSQIAIIKAGIKRHCAQGEGASTCMRECSLRRRRI